MKSPLRVFARKVIDRFPNSLGRIVHVRDRYRIWKAAQRRPDRTLVTARTFRLVNVELTNRCPFRCVMCPRTNHMQREQGLMEFELFKKVIDEYAAVNPGGAANDETYLHHFGESLVHPDFGKFMRYAVSKGIRACMSINPLMLTPAVARDLLEARPYKLFVSLDGHNDETFQKIRGVKNAYEKSRENLLEFLKLKIRMESKTLILLSMIDFSLNKESIDRLHEYWSKVPGVDEFVPKAFSTWNGDADDVVRLWDEKKQSNDELRKKLPLVLCNNPWQELSVTWDGDVVPCGFDYDKKMPLGNAGRQTLMEIWNGERMQAMRKEFMNNRVTNPLCRSCAYLYTGFHYA